MFVFIYYTTLWSLLHNLHIYVILISQHKHFHENYKTKHSKKVFNEFLDIINIGFDTKFESLAPVICKI